MVNWATTLTPPSKVLNEALLIYPNIQYHNPLLLQNPASDANENDIGLSSGKLFRHLSIGQPVIVSPCPGLSSVVEKYKIITLA